jgi:hypothetical protein
MQFRAQKSSVEVSLFAARMVFQCEYLAQAVRRGASLLDKHYPGWEHIAIPEQFLLSCTGESLLSHLYGTFDLALERLQLRADVAPTLGFTLDVQDAWMAGIWNVLWKQEINHRRE